MDRFHIFQEIGKGKYSQVYKGREKKKIKYVAIKRVDKNMMNNVVNEVQIMHRLRHPHLMRFDDWYETKNNLWLILEYCTGGDLQSLLQQDGHIPEASVKMFALDILAGLKYLHGLGLLHCDLQPKNILIDEYGILKLSDFKLTRRIPKTPLGSQSMASRGCPLYMAPELFSSEGVHSFSTDFWALGCIMFELRMNGTPFSCKWLKDQNGRHVDDQITVSSSYQEEIDGTPQDILENMRKYQLPAIVDIMIEKYKRLERNRTPHRNKSPSKTQHSTNSGSRDSYVPTISPELMDLLCWILERAPPYRCTWEQLSSHPFWISRTTGHPPIPETIPKQPAFETMLKQFDDAFIEEAMLDNESLDESLTSTAVPVLSQFNQQTPTYSEKRSYLKNTDADDISTKSGVEYNTRRATSSHAERPRNTPVKKTDIELINNTETIIGEEIQLSPIPIPLIMHSSDTQVKPIINNRYIEPIEKYSYSKSSAFQFNPLTLEALEALSPSKIETFMTTVYKSFQLVFSTSSTSRTPSSSTSSSSSSMTDKINLLSYLCTIASNSEVANIALSKPFLFLILQCIKAPTSLISQRQNAQRQQLQSTSTTSSSSTSPRSLAAALLALFIRYANFIEPPLNSNDEHIISVLIQVLKDPSLIRVDPVLRHKCIAALGELIFYISAQDDTSNIRWIISNEVILLFSKSLSDDTDEIMRHYAAKTIENVLIQGVDSVRSLFGTVDIATRLLDLAQNSRNTTIQAVCGMALFHLFNMILRLSNTPSLLSNSVDSGRFIVRVMEKTVLTGFLDCLRDGRPKLQQAYLNILITIFAGGLLHADPSPSSSQLSSNDESLRSIRYYFLQISNQLFVILCRLIDQGGSIAIKGKAILVIELICRYQPLLISTLCEHRLHNILTKILDPTDSNTTPQSTTVKRDNPGEVYVTQCVKSFIGLIQYLLSQSVMEIIQELKNLTHFPTPRGFKLIKNKTADPLPPPLPPPPPPGDIHFSPRKGGINNQYETPTKSPNSIKKSRSTPTLGTRGVTTSSSPSPSQINDFKVDTEREEDQSNTSISILRGCISLISHPSLQRHVINSRYIYSLSTALQLISDFLGDKSQYQLSQPAEEKDFLITSEQSILFALESISQIDFLDPSLDSNVFKSAQLYLIPAAVSYCRICDGDARVIVMFALRKIIPNLASSYYKTHEMRSLFFDQVLLPLPIFQHLHDHSPVPQYMIRLLSDISSISQDCCYDLSACFLYKSIQLQENLSQSLYHLLHLNPSPPSSHPSSHPSSQSNPPSDPSHEGRSPQDMNPSDPQVLILIRQLLSSNSSEFYSLQMKSGLCSIVNQSLLSSIQSYHLEYLLVTLELFLTLLSLSRNELQKNQQPSQQQQTHPTQQLHITSSSILTSLEANFQSSLPYLMSVLQWNPSDPSQERGNLLNIDNSLLFLTHDCILKSLLILIEICPEMMMESLLQDKLSSQRITQIFQNDQWDLRLLSKFLNILLKILKIPTTRKKELKSLLLSPENRLILSRNGSLNHDSYTATLMTNNEEGGESLKQALTSIRKLSEQLLNV